MHARVVATLVGLVLAAAPLHARAGVRDKMRCWVRTASAAPKTLKPLLLLSAKQIAKLQPLHDAYRRRAIKHRSDVERHRPAIERALTACEVSEGA